jgi:hypothetical protein
MIHYDPRLSQRFAQLFFILQDPFQDCLLTLQQQIYIFLKGSRHGYATLPSLYSS